MPPLSVITADEAPVALGVSTVQARKKLLSVIDGVIQDAVNQKLDFQSSATAAGRCSADWPILACAFVLILAFALGPRSLAVLATVVILVLNAALNAWLRSRIAAQKESEITDTAQAVVGNFMRLKGSAGPDLGPADCDISMEQPNRSVTTVPAYRDGLWQRVPTHLLVSGDIIALQEGEPAPAKARLLPLPTAVDGEKAEPSSAFGAAASRRFLE